VISRKASTYDASVRSMISVNDRKELKCDVSGKWPTSHKNTDPEEGEPEDPEWTEFDAMDAEEVEVEVLEVIVSLLGAGTRS
jgi:hypothetical protein